MLRIFSHYEYLALFLGVWHFFASTHVSSHQVRKTIHGWSVVKLELRDTGV